MRKTPEVVERPVGSRAARRLLAAGWIAALGAVVLPQAARAQFFFWDRPHYSADDVARSVMDRGFRPLMRPTLNEGVYVADVLDRRGLRERLIVSADTGQIVQRFMLDSGRAYRRDYDASIPRGPVPPGRIPDESAPPSRLSRAFPGDDADVNGGILGGPGRDLPPPAPPKRRRPKAAERTPEPPRPATIESAPLASAPAGSPAPATGAATAIPAQQPPAVAVPAGTDRPVRSVTTNPLALPGNREEDDKPARGASTAQAAPAHKPVAPVAPAPVKAAAPAAPSKDVPVAPLD